MHINKRRMTAKLIRYTGKPKAFYVRLESPDDGTTPGLMLDDADGRIRQFTLTEGQAWLRCYLYGGTPEECEKAFEAAATLEAKELAAAQSKDSNELKRRIARDEVDLKIAEERTGKGK